jgi:hypothetical protein
MSTREEGCYSGPFDTREEAVAEIDENGVGFVGYEGPLKFGPLLCARSILESLAEDVCRELSDEHPDYDSWPGSVSKAQEDELGAALNAALKAWMDKHGFALPNVILGVERIDRREEAARG